jgi:hypothetical protein
MKCNFIGDVQNSPIKESIDATLRAQDDRPASDVVLAPGNPPLTESTVTVVPFSRK